nr:hypothetical protein BHI3_14100 [Bacteriovorax sp. HI3]
MGVSTNEGILLFGLFKIFLGLFFLAMFLFFRRIKLRRGVSKKEKLSFSLILIVLHFGLIVLNWYLELPGYKFHSLLFNSALTVLLGTYLVDAYFVEGKKADVYFEMFRKSEITPSDLFALIMGVIFVVIGIRGILI